MDDGLIDVAILENLAGTAAFRRGAEYFSAGAVGRLHVAGDRVTARVEGSESYKVELRDDGGDLAYDCSCPRAADGYFCKHCVAVGLAWLAEQAAEGGAGAGAGGADRQDPWREIREHLATQPPQTLVELLLDVARRDERLYQSLLLRARTSIAAGGGGNVVEAFRRAIDDTTRSHGFLDWHEAGGFAADVGELADSLEELLKPETSAALVELTEYAIERVESAMAQADDSNGEIGAVACRLGALHLAACEMARPDAAALAERLFRLETTLEAGEHGFDAQTYRDVLGAAGLRRYRELAEAEWRKFGPRDSQDPYDHGRYRITRIMEQLAEASGDVEELVSIKSCDLSSGYRYLDIAQVLMRYGQADRALEWAERGLAAFPERPDNRLRDFVVAACLERGRTDDALQLTWIQFDERPLLEHFKKLHDVAGGLGVWAAQRERALARVAEAVARDAAGGVRMARPSAPDQSLRVEIALWENDLDAAWAAIHRGSCSRTLLVALAGKLEAQRPADATSIYRRVVPSIVEQTNNAAYADAIKLIGRVGALMKTLDQSRQFEDYVAELRVQFKPKRNFIKLLDGVARSALP